MRMKHRGCLAVTGGQHNSISVQMSISKKDKSFIVRFKIRDDCMRKSASYNISTNFVSYQYTVAFGWSLHLSPAHLSTSSNHQDLIYAQQTLTFLPLASYLLCPITTVLATDPLTPGVSVAARPSLVEAQLFVRKGPRGEGKTCEVRGCRDITSVRTYTSKISFSPASSTATNLTIPFKVINVCGTHILGSIRAKCPTQRS